MDRRLKITLWKYYAFSFFVDMLFVSAVLVPFFTQWGKISLFQVMLLQSWFSLWFFILEVPTGLIADRIGRKWAMTFGAIIVALSCILYGSVNSLPFFFLSEFFFAVGISLISGADEAFIYDALKEQNKAHEAKKYFGRINSIQLIGIFVSGIIGSFIAANLGLNITFILSAIPVGIAAIIAYTFKEPKIKKDSLKKERVFTALKSGFVFVLSHKMLRLLVIDYVIVATVAYFVIWLYQPVLQNIGIGIAYFGIFQGILTLSQIAISNNFSFLEKISGGAKPYLKFSLLATALSFLLVALLPNPVTIIIFVLFAGGLGLTRGTLLASYMHNFIPSENRALVISSISTFIRLSIAVFNPIVGLIATHNLQLTLFLLGIVPLMLLIFSPIKKEMLIQNKP